MQIIDVPFDEKWEKEMKQWTKNELIRLLKEIILENRKLREAKQ